MRILLDECLPRRLTRDLAGHEVRTVPEMGWASKQNGELLRLAEAHFDAFLTVDRHLASQQDVRRFTVAVVVLVAKSNRRAVLLPLMPAVLAHLETIGPGQVVKVGG